MVIRDEVLFRPWRIPTVLDSLYARFHVYIPLELKNPVVILLYYSKCFIYHCDTELNESERLSLDAVERTHRSQGRIAKVARRLVPL